MTNRFEKATETLNTAVRDVQALAVRVDGLAAELVRQHARFSALAKYASHMHCARNALGGEMVECTCGLDALLHHGEVP